MRKYLSIALEEEELAEAGAEGAAEAGAEVEGGAEAGAEGAVEAGAEAPAEAAVDTEARPEAREEAPAERRRFVSSSRRAVEGTTASGTEGGAEAGAEATVNPDSEEEPGVDAPNADEIPEAAAEAGDAGVEGGPEAAGGEIEADAEPARREEEDDTAAGGEAMSLEEEQIMLEEAGRDRAEVEQDLAEAERIIEVSDALEDLAVIADGIRETTPAEAALIETAGNMAVAGTDVEPEEIVPAMEGYIGKRIATEDLREKAAAIWHSIQEFLKGIWEKIESFFHKMLGVIPNMQKRIAQLKERAKQAGGKAPKGTKIPLGGLAGPLMVNGKAPSSGRDLAAGFKNLEAAVAYVYGDYMKAVAARGDVIAQSLAGFNPKDAFATVRDLKKKLVGASFGKIPGAKPAGRDQFPGFNAEMGPQLMGRASLVMKYFRPENNSQDDLAVIDRIRQSGVELVREGHNRGDVKGSEIEVLTSADMNTLLGAAENMLKTLEGYQRGQAGAMKASRQKLEEASAKATEALAHAEGESEGGNQAIAAYRASLNFNASYAKWVHSPATPMLGHALTVIRAIMAVCDKSIAAYSKGSAQQALPA